MLEETVHLREREGETEIEREGEGWHGCKQPMILFAIAGSVCLRPCMGSCDDQWSKEWQHVERYVWRAWQHHAEVHIVCSFVLHGRPLWLHMEKAQSIRLLHESLVVNE